MFLYRYASLKIDQLAYVYPSSDIRSKVSVGKGSYINGKIRIVGGAEVRIGKYCAMGSDIHIISSNHDIAHANLQYMFANRYIKKSVVDVSEGPVVIGNNVWVGDLAIILPGVRIGDGAVVAAGSVVTKDVEPFSVVAGNPAKLIKYRFNKKKIRKLIKIRWWNWSAKKIKANRLFFTLDLTGKDDIVIKKK